MQIDVAALRQSSVRTAYATPVKAWAGVRLAPRRNIAVAHHRLQRIVAAQLSEQPIEGPILDALEGGMVAALELDADGEVVAVLPPQPVRNAGVPCPPRARNELDQLAVTADEEVGRYPQGVDLTKIRMRFGIEAIGE